jgi:hypothetical protein
MDEPSIGVVGSLIEPVFPDDRDPHKGQEPMGDTNGSLMTSGFGRVWHNKRYILWFWLMNLTLAEFATAGFRKSAHAILDHSLEAGRLLHGFDLGTMVGLLVRPELGQMDALTMPAAYFAFVFLLATALFLPGVFAGYASTYRLPREDFFRACGRNLWRFIRLMCLALIVMGIIAGGLFTANSAIAKKASENTNELLPFELRMTGLALIFLIMTAVRIWFDLAEADVVLNDQRAVRKSLAAAFKHTWRGLPRLLTSYVLSTMVAAIVLLAGLWIWNKALAPESIPGAFLIGQFTLLLLLLPRFWQRGIAVSYWQAKMLVPVAAFTPVAHAVPPSLPVVSAEEPAPIPSAPQPSPGA